MNTPEPGQLVSLRNRFYTVTDIYPHDRGSGKGITNRVELECFNDDRIGETLSVIREREVNTKVIDHLTLPEMVGRDDRATFNSFVRSIRWSASSVLSKDILHCPFMGYIELEPYQLEPVVRVVTAPRVNLLIADDVGLGKTIEAGLVLKEMICLPERGWVKPLALWRSLQGACGIVYWGYGRLPEWIPYSVPIALPFHLHSEIPQAGVA